MDIVLISVFGGVGGLGKSGEIWALAKEASKQAAPIETAKRLMDFKNLEECMNTSTFYRSL